MHCLYFCTLPDMNNNMYILLNNETLTDSLRPSKRWMFPEFKTNFKQWPRARTNQWTSSISEVENWSTIPVLMFLKMTPELWSFNLPGCWNCNKKRMTINAEGLSNIKISLSLRILSTVPYIPCNAPDTLLYVSIQCIYLFYTN